MIERHFEIKAPSPANATGEGNRFAPQCSNADRHTDDARPNRFEPLNDTTGRTKRLFCKTPPPPIYRHQSKSGAADPPEDFDCGSARLNRLGEPPQRHDSSPEARVPQDTATIEHQGPELGTLPIGRPPQRRCRGIPRLCGLRFVQGLLRVATTGCVP